MKGYRQAYERPAVLEIQRRRAERLAPTAAPVQIVRVQPALPFYPVVKQFISSIPAPVRGSIALAMACAPRSAA